MPILQFISILSVSLASFCYEFVHIYELTTQLLQHTAPFFIVADSKPHIVHGPLSSGSNTAVK